MISILRPIFDCVQRYAKFSQGIKDHLLEHWAAERVPPERAYGVVGVRASLYMYSKVWAGCSIVNFKATLSQG